VNHSVEEILHVEKQLQQAMMKNDVQALERLLHDELTFIGLEGNVHGKQDDLASHAARALQLTELAFVEPPAPRFYGEMAIVVVKAHMKGTFQGTPFDGFYRYLRMWLLQDKRWQIVAGNVSLVAY
jgi:ketosteroid isomerase-like protein